MKITLSSDCGNSPRMALVADLAVAWAADDKDTLGQWLVNARFDGAEDVNAAVVVGEDVGFGALCSELPGGHRACVLLDELQFHKDEVGVQGHGEGDRFRAMPPRIIPGGRRRDPRSPCRYFQPVGSGRHCRTKEHR